MRSSFLGAAPVSARMLRDCRKARATRSRPMKSAPIENAWASPLGPHVIESHCSDIPDASAAERSIICRAPVLTVELEQLEAKFARAGEASHDPKNGGRIAPPARGDRPAAAPARRHTSAAAALCVGHKNLGRGHRPKITAGLQGQQDRSARLPENARSDLQCRNGRVARDGRDLSDHPPGAHDDWLIPWPAWPPSASAGTVATRCSPVVGLCFGRRPRSRLLSR
jgi:hypothetical protein